MVIAEVRCKCDCSAHGHLNVGTQMAKGKVSVALGYRSRIFGTHNIVLMQQITVAIFSKYGVLIILSYAMQSTLKCLLIKMTIDGQNRNKLGSW